MQNPNRILYVRAVSNSTSSTAQALTDEVWVAPAGAQGPKTLLGAAWYGSDFPVTNLDPNTSYQFYARSVGTSGPNGSVYSAFSPAYSGSTTAYLPATPTTLQATVSGPNLASLTFTEPPTQSYYVQDGYVVEYATDSGFTNVISHQVVGNAPRSDVTGLLANMTYYARAQAFNSLGASGWGGPCRSRRRG